jgi:murein DD-endopeptidase MepM/ murein hydrolase activator NlpD
MWDFIKKIFSERDGDVTVVVLDEHNPDGSSSFKLRSIDIIKLGLLVVIISVIITIVMFFATPLGSLYQHQQDLSLRNNVLEISERVSSLQDSLAARDMQLQDMREVLRTSRDTVFTVQYRAEFTATGSQGRVGHTGSSPAINAYEMLSPNEIILSGRMGTAPDFPANYPLSGTLTQEYSSEKGHYGIDIAAHPGTEFRALADGTVVNAGWTINYGYVIYLQHANGIMSIYKHGAKVTKQKGDFVLKGDILGKIGDRGVLSSGSHLHLEIWRNGVPQNPQMYLIN